MRVFVALDYPAPGPALELARALAPLGVAFKVGLELFTAGGPAAVRDVQAVGGPVFLDLKLHDIPNTMAGAARAAAALGVGWLTAHASAGAAALTATAAACPEVALLGVTVLTSLGEGELAGLGVARPLREQVRALGVAAVAAGCRGVVCSPREVALLRQALPPGALVAATGVRPAGVAAGDQARFASPAETAAAGADMIVVGRAVTAAPDPVAACRAVLAELGA
jgi:orotidine-5'-phosphate decarboxylase